jgi:fumarate reductase subunit D
MKEGQMAKKSIEPLLWTLFSGGGVVAALLVPIHLLIFGLVIPLDFVSEPEHRHLLDLLRHPLTRVYLFVLCTLALFHAAHRFRYTLYDGLQIKHLNEVINAACYGGAIIGSLLTCYLLWQVP